jgi:hypothetical protein
VAIIRQRAKLVESTDSSSFLLAENEHYQKGMFSLDGPWCSPLLGLTVVWKVLLLFLLLRWDQSTNSVENMVPGKKTKRASSCASGIVIHDDSNPTRCKYNVVFSLLVGVRVHDILPWPPTMTPPSASRGESCTILFLYAWECSPRFECHEKSLFLSSNFFTLCFGVILGWMLEKL